MYRNRRILSVICARGGSKGVPLKNLKPLLGKPLIAHTIEQVKKLDGIDRIIVSTDSPVLKKISLEYGAAVPFLRPKRLATDTTPTVPVLIHAVSQAEKLYDEVYDIIIYLDPTNPIRTPRDIQGALDLLIDHPETLSVLSVVESCKNPYFNMLEVNDRGYAFLSKKINKPIGRRQDAPCVYSMNASIYILRKGALVTKRTFFTHRTRLYHMSEDTSIDIDTSLGFELVTFLMQRRRKKDL